MRAWHSVVFLLLSAGGLAAEEPAPTVLPAVDAAVEIELDAPKSPWHGRVYSDAEYLLTRIRASRLPPLLIAAPTVAPLAGPLGEPETHVLLQGKIDDIVRSGGRFTLGYWEDMEKTLAFEVRGFFLGERAAGFAAHADGLGVDPILARPYINVGGGIPQEDVVFISNPGVAGGIFVTLSNEMWGLEVNRRAPLCDEDTYRIDWLLGFRHVQMKDELDIASSSQFLMGDMSRFDGLDSFHVRNRFSGGQLGAIAEAWHGPLSLSVRGTLALGGTTQEVHIAGRTMQTTEGSVTGLPFNLLTQSTNIGKYRQNEFSALPELTARAELSLSEHIRLFAGYHLLYWSDVSRAAKAIDLRINTTQNPGPVVGAPLPRFEFQSTQFWLQGLTVGVAVEF